MIVRPSMRVGTSHLVAAAICVCAITAMAQRTPKNLSVQLEVRQRGTNALELTWDSLQGKQVVIVSRKRADAGTFVALPLATRIAANSWIDTVKPGMIYDYRVERYDSANGNGRCTGFVRASLDATMPSLPGRVLRLVDSTMAIPLAEQLVVHQRDLENEGFVVQTTIVPRHEQFSGAGVQKVRSIIEDEFFNDSLPHYPLRYVVLIGRVAVPYSGDIAPDGHPDHRGAWPCDGIYGDVQGSYTDNTVTIPNNSRPANRNVPNDGKFDQSTFSQSPTVAIGRIDACDLPIINTSEVELLRNYFLRNHNFRSGGTRVVRQGVIDDNFGGYGEFFATSGWRNFCLFGGRNSVRAGDYFSKPWGADSLKMRLWTYGCGGGTDTSASGVGTSSTFATAQGTTIFSMLFGSYFGDYNTTNNIMRVAQFTSTGALATMWAGRPSMYVHHMAAGEPVGTSLLMNQGNISATQFGVMDFYPHVFIDSASNFLNFGDRGVHIALLGDPTLRVRQGHLTPLRTTVDYTPGTTAVTLSFKETTNPVAVFRATNTQSRPLFVTIVPKGTMSNIDTINYDGIVHYYTFPVGLDTVVDRQVYYFGNLSYNAVNVTTTSITEQQPSRNIFPQPASTHINIEQSTPWNSTEPVEIFSATGYIVAQCAVHDALPNQPLTISVESLPPGFYTCKIGTSFLPFIIQR
jgi:hypothetical protein